MEFEVHNVITMVEIRCFQPIFRPHAQEHIAPEPVFHDMKTRVLAKKDIDLHFYSTNGFFFLE